jgi:hypothetical protein
MSQASAAMRRQNNDGDFESLRDSEGSVMLGWIAKGVYYVRLVDGVSADLGMEHVRRLERELQTVPTLFYFTDVSSLRRYDMLARSAFLRLILQHRQKFSSLVALVGLGSASAATDALAAALGQVINLVHDPKKFDQLLVAVAPLARLLLDPRTAPQLLSALRRSNAR